MKKKVIYVGLAITISAIFGGLTGFLGSNLVIDNGRIEFKNTSRNVYIGEEAGLNDDTDINLPSVEAHNIGIGRRALWKIKAKDNELEGTRNVCVGGHCMHEAFTADRNACFGVACLYSNVSGKNNTSGGYHALADNTSSNAVGFGAYVEENNENPFMSVTLGAYAARYNHGNKNVLLGGGVAGASTNINNSVYLGVAAGNMQSTGDNNIIIGFNQQLDDLVGSNQMNIGGVFKSPNVYTGNVRMRKEAGLELVNAAGDVYRITIDMNGNIDITLVP